MSNQENWRCFILAIRNNGLQYEDGKWNSWVVLNQLWNCNLQQHFGHYEYWTVTQKWINFLNCNFGTLRFWTTFLGLECFYRHSNSKTSNQKTKHILVLLLGILHCDAKMRNETAGYYCITFKIVAFGNIEESTFEL